MSLSDDAGYDSAMSNKPSINTFSGHQAEKIVARFKAMSPTQKVVALKKSGLWSRLTVKSRSSKHVSAAGKA